MTYKDTVYHLLANYGFCENRLYVDDHLFACFGTGYSWIDGQLVADEYPEDGDADEVENIAKANYTSLFENRYDEVADKYNDYNPIDKTKNSKVKTIMGMSDREFKNWIDNLVKEAGIEPKSNIDLSWHVYPFCEEYSPIANIPDDIQSDWLEAIEHFVDYLIEHPEYVSNPSHDNINDFTKSEAAKRPEILRKAKERINSLKNNK